MANDEAYIRLRDERDSLKVSVSKLLEENARLREALEFYAERSDASIDDQDGGNVAKCALAGH